MKYGEARTHLRDFAEKWESGDRAMTVDDIFERWAQAHEVAGLDEAFLAGWDAGRAALLEQARPTPADPPGDES